MLRPTVQSAICALEYGVNVVAPQNNHGKLGTVTEGNNQTDRGSTTLPRLAINLTRLRPAHDKFAGWALRRFSNRVALALASPTMVTPLRPMAAQTPATWCTEKRADRGIRLQYWLVWDQPMDHGSKSRLTGAWSTKNRTDLIAFLWALWSYEPPSPVQNPSTQEPARLELNLLQFQLKVQDSDAHHYAVLRLDPGDGHLLQHRVGTRLPSVQQSKQTETKSKRQRLTYTLQLVLYKRFACRKRKRKRPLFPTLADTADKASPLAVGDTKTPPGDASHRPLKRRRLQATGAGGSTPRARDTTGFASRKQQQQLQHHDLIWRQRLQHICGRNAQRRYHGHRTGL